MYGCSVRTVVVDEWVNVYAGGCVNSRSLRFRHTGSTGSRLREAKGGLVQGTA